MLYYLYKNYEIAFKGRNKKEDILKYKFDLENNILNFKKDILNFTYVHNKYLSFVANDSKKRLINAPCFEDHILHHCVFRVLENVFDKKFIYHSYANRIGKGSHLAVFELKSQCGFYDYFLKMDITKYFASINQDILLSQIQRHISDEMILFYIEMIIRSYKESLQSFHFYDKNSKFKVLKKRSFMISYVLLMSYNKGSVIHFFHSGYTHRVGIPIGNVTSQIFANIYLHDLDFYVEHTLKPYFKRLNKKIFYVRYVDDFVFLAQSKEDLL